MPGRRRCRGSWTGTSTSSVRVCWLRESLLRATLPLNISPGNSEKVEFRRLAGLDEGRVLLRHRHKHLEAVEIHDVE